jgi:hypothetical protein
MNNNMATRHEHAPILTAPPTLDLDLDTLLPIPESEEAVRAWKSSAQYVIDYWEVEYEKLRCEQAATRELTEATVITHAENEAFENRLGEMQARVRSKLYLYFIVSSLAFCIISLKINVVLGRPKTLILTTNNCMVRTSHEMQIDGKVSNYASRVVNDFMKGVTWKTDFNTQAHIPGDRFERIHTFMTYRNNDSLSDIIADRAPEIYFNVAVVSRGPFGGFNYTSFMDDVKFRYVSNYTVGSERMWQQPAPVWKEGTFTGLARRVFLDKRMNSISCIRVIYCVINADKYGKDNLTIGHVSILHRDEFDKVVNWKKTKVDNLIESEEFTVVP